MPLALCAPAAFCVVADEDVAPEVCVLDESIGELVCHINPDAPTPGLTLAYLWPRAPLLVCSVSYGTNFPLGSLMNESLPASAATSSARMVLAAVRLVLFAPTQTHFARDGRPLWDLYGRRVHFPIDCPRGYARRRR